jgi:hypothetical protein
VDTNDLIKEKMMKPTILIASNIILFLSSCTTVKFETTQPKETQELKAFPSAMVGKYIDKDKDTLIIAENSFQYGNVKSKDFSMNRSLASGEAILKKSREYYIVNLKDEYLWEVFAIKNEGKELQIYFIDPGKDNKESVKKLKEIIPVKEIKNKDGEIDYYLVNPSKSEFEMLLSKEVFSKIGVFKKIK